MPQIAAQPSGIALTGATRWVQLLLGLVCMMVISSPQYVWTLFTKPLQAVLGVTPATLQVTFSLLVVLQTFFSPFQGWLIERFGPRLLIGLGTVLAGLSWILASFTASIWTFYLTYGLIGGLGTGIVYVGVVGQIVGWFPERRGFAAGIVAAGYGMGAIVTTFPIAQSLATVGYAGTLLRFGVLFALIGLLASLGLRPAPRPSLTATGSGVPTATMLRSRLFWLMFLMMTLMATSGLMVTSQMAAFATEFGITKLMVWGMAALPLALTIDRFTNGLTRPFFGWVSDRIGRETTMALAFSLEGLAMAAWLATRSDPMLFVLLSGLVFFGWGEIFSLFPATLTDTFGTKHATQNYGCLYIAQGIGAIFGGPLASLLHEVTGTWVSVFSVAIVCDLLTAVLALVVLRPLRASYRSGRIMVGQG